MNSHQKSGSNAAVKHAIVLDVQERGNSVVVSFVSGEGEIFDYAGESKDPMCFSIQFFPFSEHYLELLVEALDLWSYRNDPVDINMENGSVFMHNTLIDCTIEVLAE